MALKKVLVALATKCILALVFLHLEALCFVRGDSLNVSPEKSLVWGPGLRADIVVPARYFMIQAVDPTGEKYINIMFSLHIFSTLITICNQVITK